MEQRTDAYPARLEIDYPESLDRFSTLLRIFFLIPISLIFYLMPVAPMFVVHLVVEGSLDENSAGIFAVGAFFLPLILMLVFRRKYPLWWFEFLLELARFSYRVSAYADLLTDKYPSTDEEQTVHLELVYPDAEQLNRLLPIVKWLLLIPHYIALAVLGVIAVFAPDHGLVRHPDHRALSALPVRLCRRRQPLVAARPGLRLPSDHRPLPTV